MQQIVGAAPLRGPIPSSRSREMSPWLDLRVPPKAEKLPARGGADAPALPEDAPAGGRARLLAAREVPLHRPRRARRGVEHVQPPRERERRPGTTALNETPGRVGPPIEPPPADVRQYWRDWLDARRPSRSGRSGRTSAAGGRSASCPNVLLRPLREPEARHAGRRCRRIAASSDPDPEPRLGADPRVLLVRLDEAERRESVPLGGAFWDAGHELLERRSRPQEERAPARSTARERRRWSRARSASAPACRGVWLDGGELEPRRGAIEAGSDRGRAAPGAVQRECESGRCGQPFAS